MIIAHICPYYTPAIGGVKQVVEELARRQVAAGHEVHVFTSDWDKANRIGIFEEVIDGVIVHRCKHILKVSSFSTVWPGVYRKLLAMMECPDVIHSHVSGHLHTYLAAKAAQKLKKKGKKMKLVITTHCPWGSKRSFAGTVANWISYKFFPALKKADAVIAITPWEHQFLLNEGVEKEKIHTIPNGMSKDFFNIIKPNNFKKENGIPEGNKVVLFFGRLNVTKNPEMFVDIARQILEKRKEKDVSFIIRGPDEGELPLVKKMLAEFPEELKGSIKLLPPTRDRHKIIEMYQAADIYLMPSRREGLPLCCHPDTLVETNEGLTPINQISINDKVLTHKGRFRKVLKTMNRVADEKLICIKPYGMNQWVKLTKEHPVWAIERPKKGQKTLGYQIMNSTPKWIEAQDLKKGDCVLFPALKENNHLKYIDLKKFDKRLKYSSKEVWYKMGFSSKSRKNSYANLAKETGETKRVIEDAMKYFDIGERSNKSDRINKVLDYLNKIKFNRLKVKRYPRFIKIDKELAYVLGWYIAEGSTGNGFIRFAMNKNEVKYALKISNVINEKFNVKGTISFEENKLSLVFCAKVLENLFSKLCRVGAKNKRIPKALFKGEFLPSVIEGLYLGDGHLNKFGWTLSTISRGLSNDVMLALTKMKKKFNFHSCDRRNKKNSFSKNIIYHINYKLKNKPISHSNKSWFVGDDIAFLIREVKEEKYKGKVYNLEVQGDNSYTTSAFCVHNCLFEAYASGLPVVASSVNGVPFELEDGVNGYLLPSSNIKSFIKKIKFLLDNDSVRLEMKKNNLKKAKGFDWDIIMQKTMDVYNG